MREDFIEIGLDKVKISNIKEYKLTTEQARKYWTEVKKPPLIVRIFLGIINQGPAMIDKEIRKSKIVDYDLLHIITHQGEELRFSEYDYDNNLHLQDKKKELDNYFKKN